MAKSKEPKIPVDIHSTSFTDGVTEETLRLAPRLNDRLTIAVSGSDVMLYGSYRSKPKRR